MAGDSRKLGDFKEHQGSDYPHMLERLVFFSDAVFAIAITLLVIEIAVPHMGHVGHRGTHIQYIQELANLLPSFFGYFLSFFVIGAYWAGHHRAFGLAATYDSRLVWPNMSMLCLIAFTPFATAFLSDNMGAPRPGHLLQSGAAHPLAAQPAPHPHCLPRRRSSRSRRRPRRSRMCGRAAWACSAARRWRSCRRRSSRPSSRSCRSASTIPFKQRVYFARARKRLAAAAAD